MGSISPLALVGGGHNEGVFLAPEGRGIFPGLSVDDNLKISVRRASDRERIYERFSNLADRRRLSAGSLSGGEQQMLTLAPTLTEQPEVLIVDEPTLGLAPRVAEFVLDLFRELKGRWRDDPPRWGESAWPSRYRRCGDPRAWRSSGVVGYPGGTQPRNAGARILQ